MALRGSSFSPGYLPPPACLSLHADILFFTFSERKGGGGSLLLVNHRHTLTLVHHNGVSGLGTFASDGYINQTQHLAFSTAPMHWPEGLDVRYRERGSRGQGWYSMNLGYATITIITCAMVTQRRNGVRWELTPRENNC